ncbi:MAG TPA: hypothetical protein VMB84_02990 [Stellaceae bacterium]|nr:hypothetical protein [Stellaceae bacterium]
MSAAVARVVVALDAVSENRAAIVAAARLAARWKAPLHAVFVEDEDLIRLAHLPFARQVTLGVGVERLGPQLARGQLRAFAERARHELAAAARRHGVVWSFEIVHGTAAASGAAAASDLFVVGATTRPIGAHFRVECRWWSVAEPMPASLLLAHREWPQATVAALLHRRDAAGERLIAGAAQLAEANDARLVVFCPPELAKAPGFSSWLDRALAGHAVAAELDLIPDEPAALYRRIAELAPGLVALDAASATPARLREFAAAIACDILVVR